MFFEVRIKDSDGKVKKVLSREALSKRYWEAFFDKSGGPDAGKKVKGRGRKPKKKVSGDDSETRYNEEDWAL
ncbi:MAG: hypothetical protein COV67_04215 [Nitrospinae bacterium CG11_big_fil_rev_8_21_14_0_20_56_8]|nr:MAG: hypothetical protein COV67_04215 [Nitrospinae bacterium CG11_big_fil_rev_8_21_14_0_20_56_8]